MKYVNSRDKYACRPEYQFYRNLICHKKIILARFYHAYLNRNLNLRKSTPNIGFQILKLSLWQNLLKFNSNKREAEKPKTNEFGSKQPCLISKGHFGVNKSTKKPTIFCNDSSLTSKDRSNQKNE